MRWIISFCFDQCSASMNVGVGSFSDPEGLEGLAHFLGAHIVLPVLLIVPCPNTDSGLAFVIRELLELHHLKSFIAFSTNAFIAHHISFIIIIAEHMLFYASEKYPLEDSYSTYISEHGGCTNAYTSSEHTNYYFDVNADCFEEALDRFAQFFIKPLMSSDATAREIKAVDSGLHQFNELIQLLYIFFDDVSVTHYFHSFIQRIKRIYSMMDGEYSSCKNILVQKVIHTTNSI
ncbi:hypothetical protein OSB04_001559 [Centaurea solstitialis]|uniref:Peptidase M16 N-terminal domain-containing protein n=1 Tax=Centaurea solstitialis TaxID=347529 RepID=A0AA38TYR0_9ASTR|nr:hypothetical protein OSB04_001559 [Centaurea solstitialis]